MLQYKPTRELMNVSTLLEHINSLDLEPPYQRKGVWDKFYQKNLISSIIDGVPINTVHLVSIEQKDGGEKSVCLDGKQRIEAIIAFYENAIRIPYKFNQEKQKTQGLLYSDFLKIMNDNNDVRQKEAEKIIRNFKNFPIELSKWPNMSVAEQVELFEKINYSKELTKDERLLSKNCYARVFSEFVLENYLPILSEKSNLFEDKRSKDITWALRILYIMSDGQINSICPNKNRLKQMRYKGPFGSYVQNLNNRIKDFIAKENEEHLFASYNKDKVELMFNEFGWSKIKEYFKMLEYIGEKVIMVKTNTTWLLTYFISYMMEKYESKIININFMEENLINIKDMYIELRGWIDSAEEHWLYIRRPNEGTSFDAINSKLNELFNKYINDGNKKYPKPSSNDRELAILEARGVCEICGQPMNNNDIEIDHINASSLNSITKFKAVHKKCNRKKSDNDLKTLSDITNYMENN